MANKKLISAIIAGIITLSSSIKAADKENSLNYQFDDEILRQTLQTKKEEELKLYQEKIASQIAILEYYHKLENSEFPTYDLTQEELISIARLCEQEQYTLEGVAAEASLMANRYELYGSNYQSLYSYVRNSGWFANASYFMDNGQVRDEAISIVRKVLIEGKRTIPRYVDNHDSISDVASISTGDASDKNDYITMKTKINNVYGSSYTFTSFNGSNDPFGYTSAQNRETLGEDHYEFTKILK